MIHNERGSCSGGKWEEGDGDARSDVDDRQCWRRREAGGGLGAGVGSAGYPIKALGCADPVVVVGWQQGCPEPGFQRSQLWRLQGQPRKAAGAGSKVLLATETRCGKGAQGTAGSRVERALGAVVEICSLRPSPLTSS